MRKQANITEIHILYNQFLDPSVNFNLVRDLQTERNIFHFNTNFKFFGFLISTLYEMN
jgi:hypothetical protein